MNITLGSLFDGSGGFPLAGTLCGVKPVWASEIEPYPIAVTKSRFPTMKHLGDISKINGTTIEPVDIISFGSPCQDLSVAGFRRGLKHEANGDEETTRSGLFMEAIRIIKEMRRATNGKYPRFALWENVPGAFSSNKGEDFRIVLEELIKISEAKATVPPAPKGGWPYADAYLGDGWSLAYRTFDAQYWGVPQRRRRIYLVTDFVGGCAPGILFEREGLRGYFEEGKNPWERTSTNVERSIRTNDCKNESNDKRNNITFASVSSTLRASAGAPKNISDSVGRLVLAPVKDTIGMDGYNGALTGDKSSTLGENCGMSTGRNGVLEFLENDENDTSVVYCMASGQAHAEIYKNTCPTLNCTAEQPIITEDIQEKGPVVLFEPRSQDGVPRVHEDVSPTLNTAQGGQRQPCVAMPVNQYPFCKSSRPSFKGDSETYIDCKVSNTLNTFDLGDKRANELIVESVPVYCVQGNCIDRSDTAGCNGKGWREDTSFTLNTIDRPAIAYTLTTGSFMQINKETSPTLAARDYKDPPLACYQNDLTENEITVPPLHSEENMKLYRQNSYTNYAEGISGTLKASGGSYGGGSESLVVEQHPLPDEIHKFVAENNIAAQHQQDLLQTEDGVSRTIAPGTHASGSHLTKTIIYNDSHYIVRRLTPTECARLQGFADDWGIPDHKDDFTDEEYRFWLEVRNTHAAINGRKEKEYTKKQLLTWYNKLHSASSEYKMWGNGVALPPTLYCMQGITDAILSELKEK